MKEQRSPSSEKIGRGQFLQIGATGIIGVAGTLLLPSCNAHEDKEVSPPEDLMQEHGLLNRLLLIYDACHHQLSQGLDFQAEHLSAAATIMHDFVEEYHERQEEQYLFPRFEKAGQLTDLVPTLREQHDRGREITAHLLSLSTGSSSLKAAAGTVLPLISSFLIMYRPHEAREDTILFPAFRKLVSKHEYDSLGEEFERNEEKRFGEDGFAMMVDKVAAIEKALGIYELSQFTPPQT
ncbi:MAG: hemerythrin domain-containing protein [Bacteroidetes bacterium]|nr:hemerythrin domain-containing protein [Bacteroidota bacterium]